MIYTHKGVVSKIRIYDPNKKGKSSAANREYCKYIATRPGVDISPGLEDRLSTGLNDENYLKYITERPNSHGLFGNINVSDLNNVSNEIEKLSKQGKNIYRGIISLSEEDARELGYLTKEKWNMLLNSTMPDVGNVFGIKIENLNWIAAFHLEKGHPHVHYMMWDTSDRVVSSFIHTSKQHKCRELISNEIYRDEYRKNVLEKTTARDNIVDLSKNLMNDTLQRLNDLLDDSYKEQIPDRIYNDELMKLSKMLMNLSNELPQKGRMSYAYMPKDIKSKIDEISKSLLDRADIGREYSTYIQKVDSVVNTYSGTTNEKKISYDNAHNDIMKRVGNIILSTAVNIRKDYEDISNQIILNDEAIGHDYNEHIIKDNGDDYNEQIIIEESNEPNVDDIESHKDYEKNDFNYNLWTKDYKLARKLLHSNTEENLKKGILKLLDEAKKDNPLAIYDLAVLEKNGVIDDTFKDKNEKSNIFKNDDFSFTKALNRFIELDKNSNNGYIQYRIGKMFFYGQGTEQNYNEAIKYIEKSISNNCSLAHYVYANMYRDGKGVEVDMYKAFEHYNLSAYSYPPNYYSFYELGKMYQSGVGTEKNLSKSFNAYREALYGFIKTDKDNPDDKLKYRIAMMYLNGIGTDKNLEFAEKYLLDSAKLNNPYAQIQLYKMYMNTNNISKQDIGFSYLKKAAEHKNEQALYELGKVLINKDSIHYDYNKGIELLKEAVEQGNKNAMYLLGKEYINNTSFYYNPFAGIKLLNEVCKDNSYASYTLAKFYLNDNSMFFDVELGMKYLRNSADSNNAYAQLLLGKMYFRGKHVDKSESMARMWTQKSIDNNCESAKVFMNYMDNCKNNLGMVYSQKIINSVLQCVSKENYHRNNNEYEKNRKKHKLGINKFDNYRNLSI